MIGADAPDAQSPDNNAVWIWLGASAAVLVTGIIVMSVFLKKRKNKK